MNINDSIYVLKKNRICLVFIGFFVRNQPANVDLCQLLIVEITFFDRMNYQGSKNKKQKVDSTKVKGIRK